jgi:hypothetical protein
MEIFPVQKTRMMKIGDEHEVEEFYKARFRDMQQSACKVVGNAWVRLIEPRKQTHYPYTKGNISAPPWWPPTTGENKVRHINPENLLKPGEKEFSTIQAVSLTFNRNNSTSCSYFENGHRTTSKATFNLSGAWSGC